MRDRQVVVLIIVALMLAGCTAQGKTPEAAPAVAESKVAAEPNRRPTTGIDDIARTGVQVTFAEPTIPAKVKEEVAKAVAVAHFGPFPADIPVTVEYKLMTDETYKSRPVYLVTYHNLDPGPCTGCGLVATNGPPGGTPPTKVSQSRQGRLTVFVDANSGAYLYALSR